MADIERRHRDRNREERDHRKREDHRHRQRSRSPQQRHEGHHRYRDGYHDDRSRGGAGPERHRYQDHSHGESHHRRDYESRTTDQGRHSGGGGRERRGGPSDDHMTNRERRGGPSDDHMTNREGGSREERHRVPGPVRSERPTYRSEAGRPPRDGERERGGEAVAEGSHRRPRRQGNEEEDVSNYEYGEGKPKSKDGGKGEGSADGASDDTLEPNYGLSGKLTAETNTFRGVVIKYNEPEEARIPKIRWRLYPFKGDEVLPTLYIHRQSAYLIGRERKICDMPVDHPSCSSQHAVIQYRLVDYTRADGTSGRRVRPYVIDLESTNGTYVNNQRIEPARYYELKEKDMLKFGFSSREYILLNENSKGDEDDEPMSDEEGGAGGTAKEGVSDKRESGSGKESKSESSEEEDEKKRKKKKKKSHKSKKK